MSKELPYRFDPDTQSFRFRLDASMRDELEFCITRELMEYLLLRHCKDLKPLYIEGQPETIGFSGIVFPPLTPEEEAALEVVVSDALDRVRSKT